MTPRRPGRRPPGRAGAPGTVSTSAGTAHSKPRERRTRSRPASIVARVVGRGHDEARRRDRDDRRSIRRRAGRARGSAPEPVGPIGHDRAARGCGRRRARCEARHRGRAGVAVAVAVAAGVGVGVALGVGLGVGVGLAVGTGVGRRRRRRDRHRDRQVGRAAASGAAGRRRQGRRRRRGRRGRRPRGRGRRRRRRRGRRGWPASASAVLRIHGDRHRRDRSTQAMPVRYPIREGPCAGERSAGLEREACRRQRATGSVAAAVDELGGQVVAVGVVVVRQDAGRRDVS